MTALQNQEEFEKLLRPHRPTQDGCFDKYEPQVGIAFGADWCGPCNRIDKDDIVDNTPGIKWYYCDVDKNDYTLGYCGLHSIPSFILIQEGIFNKNSLSGAVSSKAVINWAQSLNVTK